MKAFLLVFWALSFVSNANAGLQRVERQIIATEIKMISLARTRSELEKVRRFISKWKRTEARCRLEERLSLPPLGCLEALNLRRELQILTKESLRSKREHLERICRLWRPVGVSAEVIAGWLVGTTTSDCRNRIAQIAKEREYKEADTSFDGKNLEWRMSEYGKSEVGHSDIGASQAARRRLK